MIALQGGSPSGIKVWTDAVNVMGILTVPHGEGTRDFTGLDHLLWPPPLLDPLDERETHADLGVEHFGYRAVLLGGAGQLLELGVINGGHLRMKRQA